MFRQFRRNMESTDPQGVGLQFVEHDEFVSRVPARSLPCVPISSLLQQPPLGDARSDRIDAVLDNDPMNRIITSITTNGLKPFGPVRGTTDLVRDNQSAVRDGVSFCRSDRT